MKDLTLEAGFETRRDKLIREYQREVQPLWVESQRRIGKAGSRSFQNHLIRRFREKIRPRLKELFGEIARLKLEYRKPRNEVNTRRLDNGRDYRTNDRTGSSSN